jgi:hypothetical protein
VRRETMIQEDIHYHDENKCTPHPQVCTNDYPDPPWEEFDCEFESGMGAYACKHRRPVGE